MVRKAHEAPLVSVIVMTFNEALSLRGVLEEIASTLSATGWSFETIVVNDGSTDGSGAIADQASLDLDSVRVLHHRTNRGIGEVYRTGFGAAEGKLVTFLPADGQFPPSIIVDFVERSGSADLILGTIPGLHRPLSGRILSLGERFLYRVLFGALPSFQGIMLFRRELLGLLAIQPGGRGWGVLMEIIVKARRANLRIAVAPTPILPRTAGSSKVTNVRSVVANLRQAMDLWRRLRMWTPPRMLNG